MNRMSESEARLARETWAIDLREERGLKAARQAFRVGSVSDETLVERVV